MNELFSDITPVPQNDPIDALVPIAYSAKYTELMDLFRGVVRVNEKSPRVLDLTYRIIKMNPGHFSVWKYRGDTLIEIGGDISAELDLLDELVASFLKSYQIWQHRRRLIIHTKDPSRELAFVDKALEVDQKNYHTWCYREWILSVFYLKDREIMENEFTYIERLLSEDIRNNSAWSHRHFIASKVKDGGVSREIEFTKEKILLAPNNASAWNYLRGILNTSETPYATVEDFAIAVAKSDPKCYFAIEFLADLYAQEKEKEKSSALFEAVSTLDPIRRHYYLYRAKAVLS